MSAYVINRVNATQWRWLKEYGAPTRAIIEKHGGCYLAQGGTTEELEGKGELPTALVVLEFPDMESAKAWNNDPDYQPLKELRQANADVEIALIDGLG